MRLLKLVLEQLDTYSLPNEWTNFLRVENKTILLRGDDYGRRTIHFSRQPGVIYISDNAADLLMRGRQAGAPFPVCGEALSFLLHDGQVPFPRTIYRGMHALSIGDRARIPLSDGEPDIGFSVEFPYFTDNSRQDENPDPAHLLRLLTNSVAMSIEKYTNGILMLSAGKDSTALALALAETGRKDIVCVTYTSPGDDEYIYARELCAKLGLKHRIVSLQSAGTSVRETLENFFTNTPFPAGDLAQIPTLLLLKQTGTPQGVVLEGSGNDVSFGYVPRKKDLRAMRFSLGRWAMADMWKRLVPPQSQLNYLLRDPVEINWPGLRVRHTETSRLLCTSINTSQFWRGIRNTNRNLDTIDLRGFLRGRHFEIGSQKEKIELAANALEMHGEYPFQDREVTDYYFNLPESERFCRKDLINKVLLRKMLRHYANYDDRAIGKQPFQFDGAAFIENNRSFLHEELLECKLFKKSQVNLLLRRLDQVLKSPFGWHHIIGLFQFAGWYNHSRFLRD